MYFITTDTKDNSVTGLYKNNFSLNIPTDSIEISKEDALYLSTSKYGFEVFKYVNNQLQEDVAKTKHLDVRNHVQASKEVLNSKLNEELLRLGSHISAQTIKGYVGSQSSEADSTYPVIKNLYNSLQKELLLLKDGTYGEVMSYDARAVRFGLLP